MGGVKSKPFSEAAKNVIARKKILENAAGETKKAIDQEMKPEILSQISKMSLIKERNIVGVILILRIYFIYNFLL